MSATKLREPRVPVLLSVRVKTDFGWGDAHVQNVSTRGMMATCITPPSRGTYVEVRRGAYVVVGRVIWSSRDRFGLFAQDAIDLSDLISTASPRAPADRRREPRTPEPSRVHHKCATEIGAASARFARTFDFAALTAVAIGAALLVAETASEMFATPLQDVRIALGEAQ